MDVNYILQSKSSLRRMKISDISVSVPDMKNSEYSKVQIITKWLAGCIEEGLVSGKITINELLPTKQDIAYHLGVSVGTIQNSLRCLEDLGYVESKQRIGTMVKDRSGKNGCIRKHTSKREVAILEIKKFIIKNKLKTGSSLPSSRALSALIGCSSNTTRLALEYLSSVGILYHNRVNPNDSGWIVASIDFNKKNIRTSMEQKTLVAKVEQDLKLYIETNLKIGDKIPSHSELSSLLKVSIKTIHDALKGLINNGILLARRGRYGTTVIKMPSDAVKGLNTTASIFAPAKDTAFYYYEKTQNNIKKMIAEHYEIGSKLPSILELSKELDLSPNTIRKAFHNLAREGYLVFSRGRYGGTFVVDIPQTGDETFKWLAVNPQYAKIYSGNN